MRRSLAPLLIALLVYGLAQAATSTAAAAPRAVDRSARLPPPITLSQVATQGRSVWAWGNLAGCGRAVASDGEPCGSALVRSADGGKTWTRVWTTAKLIIQGVSFATPLEGWASLQRDTCGWVDGSGRHCASSIVRTENGGVTWTKVYGARRASVTVIAAPAPGVAWAWTASSMTVCDTGRNCPVELMADTGPHGAWQVVDRVPGGHGFGGPFTSLENRGRLLGWTEGPGGTILATNDGGRRWSVRGRLPLRSSSYPLVQSIDFVSARDGWLTECDGASVGNGGCMVSLFATRDGGRSWHRQFQAGCIDWMAVHMRTPKRGVLLTGGATACQSPSPHGANAATGTDGNSNADYRTGDGGGAWRRTGYQPAVLRAVAWSGAGAWSVGYTCLYACRTFVAALHDGAVFRTAYPGPVLPLSGTALPDGETVAVGLSAPGAKPEVYVQPSGSDTWRAAGYLAHIGVRASVLGMGAMDGKPLWWLEVAYPSSSQAVWIVVGNSEGRVVAQWRARPPGGAITAILPVALRTAWAVGCAPAGKPGCVIDTLYGSNDAGRAWTRLAGPAGMAIDGITHASRTLAVLAQAPGCVASATEPACAHRLFDFNHGAWHALPPPAASARGAVIHLTAVGGAIAVWWSLGDVTLLATLDHGAWRTNRVTTGGPVTALAATAAGTAVVQAGDGSLWLASGRNSPVAVHLP